MGAGRSWGAVGQRDRISEARLRRAFRKLATARAFRLKPEATLTMKEGKLSEGVGSAFRRKAA
jgi:hypothetical protein